MPEPDWLPADSAGTVWDAIVVGTGMGGATVGFALARQGWRVLFVEKGPMLHGADRSATIPEGAGWWPHQAHAFTNIGNFDFPLPVGCASGGSSAFYAGALERFFPEDFAPRRQFPQAPDSTLPESWPITYDDLEPYYEQAESLFRVRGTPDALYTGRTSPLLPPPALSERDKALQAEFTAAGLHPYRLHVGCEFVAGCDECPSGPCHRNCRRDAASVCLLPAVTRYGAKLLPECEVLRIEAGPDRVDSVLCRTESGEIRLRAKVFVLAAGAFATPAILLRSASEVWPDGVANRSGLVGRNLMFHSGNFFAIAPLSADAHGAGPQKTLALNDFYNADGEKLGTFQTVGRAMTVSSIMHYLRESAASSNAWWRWFLLPEPVWWRKLCSPFVRAGALIAYHLFGFRNAAVWASIVEDLPYYENRVTPDPANPDDVRFDYRYTDELRQRVSRFRNRLKQALPRHRIMVLSTGDKLNYPHVCGTCRFGDDPSSSVLNRDNRAHDLTNLYVADASFFPSGAGTNPSLTIAANAIRVAEAIARASTDQV